jgi:glycosyltransferase involved in cell wall biosynthesis
MNVCLVTLDFPPYRTSGLTVYAEQVVRGLSCRGHQVSVLASQRPADRRTGDIPLPENITVIRLPVGKADWIGLGWQAARLLRAGGADYDVVHFADVHFAYAHRGPFVASGLQSFRQRLAANQGLPYYSSRRNLLFRFVYYNAARWLLEWPTARRAQHLLMVSGATRNEFLEHYGVEPSRASIVHIGIDLERFSHLPDRELARRKLGLPAGLPILLYVGFSTARKGLEYLAEALCLMRSRAQLLVVGSWEKGYRKRFTHALGPARRQATIVGYVPDSELLTYFAAADAFVLPSLLEGFGIPPVEAMAAGLPVVATTAGALGEIIGDAGLQVPPSDALALGVALDRVLSDADLARQLREAGRARARSLFDERRMASQIEAVYEQCLGSR